MTSLTTEADDLDVDKLKTDHAFLNKLSNVMDNDFEKAVYNQLVIKVSAFDTKIPTTSGLITKTQYESDKQSLEKKSKFRKMVPETGGLPKKGWPQHKNYRY